MDTNKMLNLLLEAIDYSFLQSNGEYDKVLTYPVIDKVNYIKKTLRNQPSLPSNLDEAATDYAKEEYNRENLSALPNRCRGCYAPLIYAFKAGAEWMANQNDEH